jgi:ComF family protein
LTGAGIDLRIDSHAAARLENIVITAWRPVVLLSLWKDLLNLVFPQPVDCPFCGGARQGKDLCAQCLSVIRGYNEEIYCSRCGRFTGKGSVIPKAAGHFCFACRKQDWPFDLARAAGPYEGVLKEAIHRFKYLGRRGVAPYLAELMAETARQEPLFTLVDLLLPVPLADEKLRARGFNQAALLAAEIGCRLQAPVNSRLLCKDFETRPQAGLTRTERESNLSGAFRVANDDAVQGKCIMIIDDVFTTGCTMSTAALVLREAGARHVFGLTAAAGRYF